MIHNEIIIINICGISSDAKYFMDLKVESERLYSISDDQETLQRYETFEELDNDAQDLDDINNKNEEEK